MALALLDLLGILQLPWFQERIALFTLLMLGIIAGYLALETTGAIERLPARIARAEGSRQVKPFESIDEVRRYARKRMGIARNIDDLTWGPSISQSSAEHRQAYQEYRQDVERMAARNDVRYREVMTFPDEERVRLAAGMIAQPRPGYELRCYDCDLEDTPPLIKFILIDDEVIFVRHRMAGLPEEGAQWIAVRQPDIVQMARAYFAEVWKGASPVTEEVVRRHESRLAGAP